MSLQPKVPFSFRELPEDLAHLKKSLQSALELAPASPAPACEQRFLNLACGRADETAVLAEVFGAQAGTLEIVGADIRAAEIQEARQRWHTPAEADLQTRFHLEDGRRFLDSLPSEDRFDLAFLRHQNFWNDPALWGRMFEGALRHLQDHGLFVITSYFDREHRLACEKLADLGAAKVADYRNPLSRSLAQAPGKSVDRHIAIFRRQRPS